MAETVELIPAIDLMGGQVVRLLQGDFDRSTTFGDDPKAIAARWVASGATRLHIVDLDGARAGRPAQRAIVERLVQAAGIRCQVAGGVRDRDPVAAYMAAGVDRVVLGTALIRDPELCSRLVTEFGAERIVAALDVRQGIAVGEGWHASATGSPLLTTLASLVGSGVIRFAVTSIDRDGTLAGPDLDLLRQVRDAAPNAAIIASGGISTIDDLRDLANAGMEAVILGRALYEGRFTLEQATVAVT